VAAKERAALQVAAEERAAAAGQISSACKAWAWRPACGQSPGRAAAAERAALQLAAVERAARPAAAGERAARPAGERPARQAVAAAAE
jgi:hypothetical protein